KTLMQNRLSKIIQAQISDELSNLDEISGLLTAFTLCLYAFMPLASSIALLKRSGPSASLCVRFMP
ncbi:MAG: hypothetical protein KAU38_03640, partial [Desulfobacterales bacterium]|nr:hypothetical protein [Desulfobacterales bacterium]